MFWLILSLVLWAIVHSLLASLKAKQLAQEWFGAQAMHFYRLLYNGFAILTFIPIFGITALTKSPILYAVPLPWAGFMVLGEFLALAGLIIALMQTDVWVFIGLRQLGESSRSTPLNTGGLYHYLRHPLYLMGLVFIWLFPYMTCTIQVFNLALTLYILIGIFLEERKLRREFGQVYIDYAAETPMLIPFLKGKKT
jgi:protein-S-isoprenylcysteine O-methyltransferase Ste14